ncbi:addiction module antidote protein [Pseudothauera lacus]|uniref:Putative addiction module antidote protein n=1 Tax=Pseudothauera lacus TaxID=2136175 RepID=A0A2T4IK19_9RHOO|nr:addiction module antidote protein [Pseudothauera lacus]PTD98109.1 putative addiction module antidote protein [Pseudothauera lacus]
MSKKVKMSELPEFDMAEHLADERAIADYLTIVLEENDPAALADALGTVARARGMTEIAKTSGITREALYKALRPTSQPRFETVSRVCAALGVKLIAVPVHGESAHA